MKKLLTLMSALVVAISLSMPVFAHESSQPAPVIGVSAQQAALQEAPAQESAPKKKVKKHHKKATKKSKKAKKQKKEKKQEGQNP